MKKIIIKTISAVLVLVTVTFAFSGCDFGWYGDGNHIFPDGYTCGFGLEPGSKVEYWWVETYEEFIAAIELLKSNGSTFETEYVLTCKEELFDVKYGFMIVGDGKKKGESIKFGDNPFDRWAYDVKAFAMVFFDDVTIDELVYSNVKYYEAYQMSLNLEAYQQINNGAFELDDLMIGDWIPRVEDAANGRSQYYLNLSHQKQSVVGITTSFYYSYEENTKDFKLTDECIKYILGTGKIVELNKE